MASKPVSDDLAAALRAVEALCKRLGCTDLVIDIRGGGRALMQEVDWRGHVTASHRLYRDGDTGRPDDGAWREEVRHGR